MSNPNKVPLGERIGRFGARHTIGKLGEARDTERRIARLTPPKGGLRRFLWAVRRTISDTWRIHRVCVLTVKITKHLASLDADLASVTAFDRFILTLPELGRHVSRNMDERAELLRLSVENGLGGSGRKRTP